MAAALPVLWGRRSSSNVQKVMWALAELGVAHDQIQVGGPYGGLDTPEFAAMNPVARVPVWQDQDLILAESHAILRHLDRVHGGLMPADAAGYAVADQWMEVASTTFLPAFVGVFWHQVRTPIAQRDAVKLAGLIRTLDAATAVLEARLQRSAWLSGDSFGLADIAAGAAMYRYWDIDIARPERPALTRWTVQLRARPHFGATVATSYDELRA